ncbi:J domain-containing protein [Streptomyces somaliensis]|nr:J domain-containing protein [Streptomyces somaliensis]
MAPTASAEQITSAYRRLVRALHPDGSPGRDETGRRAAAGRFAAVVAAYGVLRDPARRAAYDAGRRAHDGRPRTGPAAPGGAPTAGPGPRRRAAVGGPGPPAAATLRRGRGAAPVAAVRRAALPRGGRKAAGGVPDAEGRAGPGRRGPLSRPTGRGASATRVAVAPRPPVPRVRGRRRGLPSAPCQERPGRTPPGSARNGPSGAAPGRPRRAARRGAGAGAARRADCGSC